MNASDIAASIQQELKAKGIKKDGGYYHPGGSDDPRNQHHSATAQFPAATLTDKTLSKDIGVILDSKEDVNSLFKATKIAPPDKLTWTSLKTYDDFKAFLDKYGVPGYVSIGDIVRQTPKDKDNVDCARLLLDTCTSRKAALPKLECHSTLTTKRQEIEFMYCF